MASTRVESPNSSGPESSSGAFTAPTVEELGKALPQFEISEVLGQGGMGAVYKARQPRLNRYVAIKLLPAFSGPDEFNFAERFEREAQAMAQMNHSNIVTVHDFGETDDGNSLRYIVMEYVDGPDLHELIQGGQLTSQHVMGWIPQICSALQYAHERGVVHRDIKPANILINREGEAKVVDFGLATLVGPRDEQSSNTGEDEIVMGTPEYAPPEATEEGAAIDHRADIYSLGVLFYEMLTGQVPGGPWRAPSEFGGDIDIRLDAIIIKAMQPNPDDRFQSVSELSQALAELRNAPKLVVSATGGKKLLTAPKVQSRAAAVRRKPAPHRGQRRAATGMSGLAIFWIVILIAGGVLGFLWANGKLAFLTEKPEQPPVVQSPPKPPEVTRPGPKPGPDRSNVATVPPDSRKPELRPEPKPPKPEVAVRPVESPMPPPTKVAPDTSSAHPASPDTDWIDVLAKLDIDSAQFGGSWTLESGLAKAADRVTNQDQPRIELPNPLGDDYELEFVFQRASGNGNVVAMLPIQGERYAPLYLSGFNGLLVAIHGLNGESAGSPRNPTANRMNLENGRAYRVSIKVSRGAADENVRVVLDFDGDELFDWTGPAEQFPEKDSFGWIPRNKDRIALGTVSPTEFSVIRVKSETQ